MNLQVLKVVLRGIARRKGTSLVTILSLAVGMGASLLMLMYVVNETRYEEFQVSGDRIYRVALEWGQKGNKMKFAGAMSALAPAMVADLPEVERAVRVEALQDIDLRKNADDKPLVAENAIYADADYFTVFSYPWLAGDRTKSLQQPFSAVLNKRVAEALFGTTEVVGKTVLYDKTMFQITGVMGVAPLNAHLRPEIVISRASMEAKTGQQATWGSFGGVRTYVLLRKGADAGALGDKIQALAAKNVNPGLAAMFTFHIQPLKEIHWISDFMGDSDPKGNRLYLLVFLTASILVLLIACVNYINLTSSQYLERMREIGVRKVFGATWGRLLRQLVAESAVVSLTAMLIGAAIFDTAFTPMMEFLRAPVVLGSSHFLYGAAVFVVVLLAAIVAAFVPAWTLSRFQPIAILGKGTTQPVAKAVVRRVLLGFQFLVAVVLIVATVIIYSQVHFMLTTDLGFKKEGALFIPFSSAEKAVREKYDALCEEMRKIPSVASVSSVSFTPGIYGMSNMMIFKDKTDIASGMTMFMLNVDYDFMDALGLQLATGRSFVRTNPADASDGILINEEAAHVLGYDDPVNRFVKVPTGQEQIKDMTILGVVKNFHIQSLRSKIPPMIIFLRPQQGAFLLVRYDPSHYRQVSERVQQVLEEMIPGGQLEVRSMEDAWEKYYKAEQRTGIMLIVFSVLALVLSCAGLFGMTSFVLGRRVKEIGIRKVLGATTGSLMVSLTREYVALVLVANCIGWPIAYYAARLWLQDFAYQTPLSPWIFVFSGCFTLVIALITISARIVQTSRMNPAMSLRYE